MAMSIGDAFVKQYEAEVHEAYQRQGSMLSPTVRRKSNIKGESTTFQKVGKGSAKTKTRHGKVPLMNLSHTPVPCVLQDFYAGDFVDKLDELKIIHDERKVTVNAGAFALGRKTDNLIITAAGTTSNTTATGVTLTDGMKLKDATTIMQIFGDSDVPDDGDKWAVIGWHQWNHLLQIKEFASADFVSSSMFDGRAVKPKHWVGFNWLPMSTSDGGLVKADSDHTTCLFYHKSALGHASGFDVQSDITWHGDHAAHFVNNMMSQGSCLIDENAVYALSFHDTLS